MGIGHPLGNLLTRGNGGYKVHKSYHIQIIIAESDVCEKYQRQAEISITRHCGSALQRTLPNWD